MELNAYGIKYSCLSIETHRIPSTKSIHIYIIHCSSTKYSNRLLNIQLLKQRIQNIFPLNWSFVIHICTFNTLSKDNWLTINRHQKLHNKPVFSIGAIGCNLSHLWCIQYHLLTELSSLPFIVFEDDILLSNSFSDELEQHIERMINNSTIGLTMLGSLDKLNTVPTTIDEFKTYNIRQSKNILGAHANLYSISFAEEFLRKKLDNLCYIDFFYKTVSQTQNVVACFPPVAIQSGSNTSVSYSDNITTRELLLKFYDEYIVDEYILPNFSSKSII